MLREPGSTVEDGGTLWVPLKRLCEGQGIPYRYRQDRVKADTSIPLRMLYALSKGRKYRMLCIPLEYAESVAAMACPGRGGHNKKGTAP